MCSDLNHYDIIDLITERHLQFRKITEKLWNDNSDLTISYSEWFILARIYQEKQATISSISKQIYISRQATHKLIKSLEEKRLVEIDNLDNNKKMKSLKLTPFGKECFEKNASLRAELVNKIKEKIGADQIKVFKEILKTDWGL